MYFKQFYLGCLAHASYLIGSDGEDRVVAANGDLRADLGIRHRLVGDVHEQEPRWRLDG